MNEASQAVIVNFPVVEGNRMPTLQDEAEVEHSPPEWPDESKVGATKIFLNPGDLAMESGSPEVDRASSYFRRKASAVLNDSNALRLLTDVYQVGVMEKSALGFCEQCSSLAKLVAANFCEIGVGTIYITPHGNQFINNIRDA